MSQKRLRVAQLDDAAAMLAIYAPYVEKTTVSSEYEAPSLAAFEARIQTTLRDYPWIVCELDGEIVGYGYAAKHRARAAYQWSVETSIYVKESHHRHGIASAIYRAIFDILTGQGFYNIFVGITSPNERSVKFHSALGFVISGSYQDTMYKFGQWRDVLWMAKSLRPHIGEPKPTVPFSQVQNTQAVQKILSACNI